MYTTPIFKESDIIFQHTGNEKGRGLHYPVMSFLFFSSVVSIFLLGFKSFLYPQQCGYLIRQKVPHQNNDLRP